MRLINRTPLKSITESLESNGWSLEAMRGSADSWMPAALSKKPSTHISTGLDLNEQVPTPGCVMAGKSGVRAPWMCTEDMRKDSKIRL